MGASLGAKGTWRLAARLPGTFSAVINVAGTGSTSHVKRSKIKAARFYQGDQDKGVPLAKVQATVDLLKQAGADAEVQVFPGVGHSPEVFNDKVFGEPTVYQWAFGKGGAATSTAPQTKAAAAFSTYGTIQSLSAYEHRRPGTEPGRRAEAWITGRLQSLGLEVQRDDIDLTVWSPRRTALTVAGTPMAASFIANMAFIAASGVQAPLVYAGNGHAADFKGLDVRGKIVVVDAELKASGGAYDTRGVHAVFDPQGWLGGKVWDAAYPSNVLGGFIPGVAETGEGTGLIGSIAEKPDALLNSERLGAAGLLVLLPNACGMNPSAYWAYDGVMKRIPGAYVGAAESAAVREAARAGRPANLVLEGATSSGQTANLYAVLPGQSDEVVLVTSHHDSPHHGAVEDGSGVAQVLAQAAHWSRLPVTARPRTLVFVLSAGHFYRGEGGTEFARRHPEVMSKVRGMVTVEHTPARESGPTTPGPVSWSPQAGRSAARSTCRVRKT